MYRHEFPKTRKPTDEEWSRIESIANWVIENAPETGIDYANGAKERPLRDSLVTLYEFPDRETGELLDDEIPVEHAPSNVIQQCYHAPAIRMNGFVGLCGDFFTLTNDTPLNDQDHQLTHCNTHRRPYDLLVCAILALVDHQVPGLLRLRSDGTREQWQRAVDFAKGYDPSVVVPSSIMNGDERIHRPATLDFRA